LPTIEDPVQGGNVGTGWLLIFSDEPLTAWASVISNSNDDPSVELAIADQIYKPAAFVESAGTRLAVQSSAKTARFQSSLVVVNVGSDDGNLYVDIYDQLGNLIDTKTALIKKNGMFVDNDIRSAVPGTFGQIVIEVTDPTPDGQFHREKHCEWNRVLFPRLCFASIRHQGDRRNLGRQLDREPH